MLRIDQVLVAVADLDAAAERLRRELGLGSAPGGRHVGHGTANRIVPLGREYLELVAVVDPREAAGSPFGTWVDAGSRSGDGLLAWCLATADLEGICGRLGIEPSPRWTRRRPDGVELAWRLARPRWRPEPPDGLARGGGPPGADHR